MRERVEPEEYRGVYNDEIRDGDLIIMGKEPEKTAGHICAENGIYESLWRLSLETDLGLIVDVRRIPFDQSYIDRCNREDTNPYVIPTELIIYVSHPLSEYHLRKDLTVIGYLTKERVCRLINGDRYSFLSGETASGLTVSDINSGL